MRDFSPTRDFGSGMASSADDELLVEPVWGSVGAETVADGNGMLANVSGVESVDSASD